MEKHRIYFDNNSTTPVDPRVVDMMLPYFTEKPGNANSRSHPFGWEATAAVEEATSRLSELLRIKEEELVFTSGATESLNLALKGLAEIWEGQKNHIITCSTEHPAVLDTCSYLEKKGLQITYLKVDSKGHIDLNEMEDAIRDTTICVALMWANNETGVIHPVVDIGKICRRKNVFFVCDATQAVGKIPVHPKEADIDLMAFSGHKFYGPKGVGGLYMSSDKPRPRIKAQIHGGGHQNDLRSGTLNVPGIVGMGKAAALASLEMRDEYIRIKGLRDQLENLLLENIESTSVNGDDYHRLPHVCNLCFKYVEGEQLMVNINSLVAVSSGSACTSANPDPSHVLLALGLSEGDAKASIRLSLGRFSLQEDIIPVFDIMKTEIEKLREESPVWQMFKDGVDLEKF
ncbi:cysteine desulfurase family protein [Membranihabitans maritimus]|uniref:cysteine desulfurase family protein n=1 Tax=Membranihabitans maritimus TaxID=2904244 RepID=UPI001F1A1CC6|nr:aminotransferase class V-fold PLP-dependent enzyme [Membranihabitans maritimus]